MKRSKEMEEFLNNFTNAIFGRSMNDDCCVTCGSEKINPEDFRDELSRREFNISHMCQECQDSVFGKE
jgi:hypothetical protein